MASSAGTSAITEKRAGSLKSIKWGFVCSSGAAVDSISTPTTTYPYNGKLECLHTIGTSGATAPSASWDITILDGNSVDILAGAGASRAAASEVTVGASLGAICSDTMTLTVTGAGSSNAAAVLLFLR